ncbi:MAG: adenosylcobinamide-GDP ribazoletransferase [Planctomycetota bacterium]|nr:adenosylcobinamide-GDP ribazoletransferase [Planctomycetota bacterium]MDI6787041.1 adenosylcobinamide-GDP ribazoletransferase [Planctomycetota bacterium]
MLKLFIIAIQFLTPIPLSSKEVDPKDLARSMRFFPLVGLLIGLFLVLLRIPCLHLEFSTSITATFLLLAITVASGALHLDGFGDTCDGFYAGRTREEIIKVMRDSHIGVMGVIGIFFILLLKWAVFVSFPWGNASYSNLSLILIPFLSRWAMVIATALSPYASVAHDGIGKPFTDHITRKEVFIATAIILVGILVLSFLSGYFIGFLLIIIPLIVVLIMVVISRKTLGGITGDILGAINEITEVAVLFGAYLLR